jgi:STE24 endopeptidase
VRPLSPWRRVRADPAQWFDREEVERGRAYNRPLDRLRVLRWAIGAAGLVAIVVAEAAPRLLDGLGIRGWALELAVVVIVLELISLAYGLPFDAWRVLVHDRRWDLSTQSGRGLLADQAKELGVSLVVMLLLVIPLYAVIRTTDLWWLWGWLLFSAFTVVFGLLWPVVIAPIFNRFEPLGDDGLAARVQAVADRAGLDVSAVLVADASRRSRAGNAYVAGLGRTRRVVLFDTILDWPPEVVEQIVAHELGHWRHAHLRRKLPVLIAVQLVMFLVAWALLRWQPLLDLAGVDDLGEPGSLPLLLTVLPLSVVLAQLLTSWLSRADERQADLHALDVLRDPGDFIALFHRLAERNKADVDPSWWKRLAASHPPVAERLAFARVWEEQRAS